MPVIYSDKIPAGHKRPVPVPPGDRKVSVINDNGGDGNVTFDLNGNPIAIPYKQGVQDPGTNFNFTTPCCDYLFTNNPALGFPNPPDVIVKIEY